MGVQFATFPWYQSSTIRSFSIRTRNLAGFKSRWNPSCPKISVYNIIQRARTVIATLAYDTAKAMSRKGIELIGDSSVDYILPILGVG